MLVEIKRNITNLKYSNENFTDVTIEVDGKYFKAHKVILSACSPRFERLFKVSFWILICFSGEGAGFPT